MNPKAIVRQVCQQILFDILVNASYHGHQQYIWFIGGDLDHFQDNSPNCIMRGMGMNPEAIV